MNEIDRLWAGWRSSYVSSGGATGDASHGHCVFCGILALDVPEDDTNIVRRGELVTVMLNAYPYGTGHVLVMPNRHVAMLDDLTPEESSALWQGINHAVVAIRSAYQPNGLNVGFNLGAGSGAGIPEHLHAHVLPRWKADTNFITAVANAKVLPEPLDVTWQKLRDAWPS